MTPVSRRKFLGGALLTGGALTSTLVLPDAIAEEPILAPATDTHAAIADDPAAATSHRFSLCARISSDGVLLSGRSP